ncbi:MAG: HAMP domain-containing histidine kinase [Acetobacteraceae bacterium]|nr:HAMP domain-containing histidine kinase [Acetobacteraceae bacterium]
MPAICCEPKRRDFASRVHLTRRPPVPAAAAAEGTGRPVLRLRSPPLLRSAGVRFAIIYAVLLVLSAAGLASVLWYETAGLLARQTEAAIRADAQALTDRWTIGGLPALVMTIEARLAQNVEDDEIYLLADSHYQRLAGNVRHWPEIVQESGVPYSLVVERAGIRSLAQVQKVNLPGGFHLLDGRDVRERTQLRTLITDALLWAVAVVVVLATIGALIVRSLFRRTLANISETTAAVATGDLTHRVRLAGTGDEFDLLAESVNDMLDRIGRLMDGVRQVSNAIAHDLRTPITRARARLEDAALHATTEAELRVAIERATAELDGVVAVFKALLRIAEIEAGARRSAFATFDLRPLLDDLAELYGAVAEERGMRVEAGIEPGLAVFGDTALIQQAVANLLDNAVKFSPADAVITLQGRSDPSGIAIIVSDVGPGIPEAERKKATERFFRGEAARHTPGSGLGLALVQAVAQLHGGALRLEDAAPGLRAVLMLPAVADEAHRITPT